MNNAARLVFTLATMNEDEAEKFGISEEDRKSYIRMDSGKVNITPPLSAARWFRLVGVKLGNASEQYPNGDDVQTVEPWKPPKTWEGLTDDLLNRMLTDIDAGMPDGNRYSDANAADDRAAWKVVCKHAPTKSEAQAREVIKTWIENNLLYRDSYENPKSRKKERGLYLDATKRPGTIL